ncbi:MAG: hypothetical protein ABJB11_15825 [Ferruginibacter sp.]
MKVLIACFSVLIVVALCTIFIIPGKIKMNENVFVRMKTDVLYRNLSDEKSWVKWWPGDSSRIQPNEPSRIFYFNGNEYSIADKMIYSFNIKITSKEYNESSIINIFPYSNDSVKLNWVGSMPTSLNPVKRIQQYNDAKKIEQDVQKILTGISAYMNDDEKIYGIKIYQEPVVDSILVSTFESAKGYPTQEYIYHLVDELKSYIAKNQVKETGFPMLNIFTNDSITYITKVAIPVNKKLSNQGNISYKGMLGGGKILVAEVEGGLNKVDSAVSAMELFVKDHGYVAPAIPFVSLVTDRLQQKDSNKWITRVYYPIM